MVDVELAAFAAAGRALIVGAVETDGAPYATRGWGFVLDPDGSPVVVIDADDERGRDALRPGGSIAVTAADVRTLRSIQFKGAVRSVHEATGPDTIVIEHYLHEFFTAISETDGVAIDVLRRVTPTRYLRCRFACQELFDQTPGPAAGAPVATP